MLSPARRLPRASQDCHIPGKEASESLPGLLKKGSKEAPESLPGLLKGVKRGSREPPRTVNYEKRGSREPPIPGWYASLCTRVPTTRVYMLPSTPLVGVPSRTYLRVCICGVCTLPCVHRSGCGKCTSERGLNGERPPSEKPPGRGETRVYCREEES